MPIKHYVPAVSMVRAVPLAEVAVPLAEVAVPAPQCHWGVHVFLAHQQHPQAGTRAGGFASFPQSRALRRKSS